MQDLEGQLYTNPHSGHAAWGSDISAMDCEAEARALTLAMCNTPAEDYECIFTSGATGARPLQGGCSHARESAPSKGFGRCSIEAHLTLRASGLHFSGEVREDFS